jgi:uncharacterized protein YerC
MILSKQEKEAMVVKLLNEGLTYKDISNHIHISLSNISKIKRKITGEEIEKEKPLSIHSQTSII